jgi:hypothetical protein
MVTVTRSARGLERAMTGKKYADQYDHTHLPMAGWGLEQQVQAPSCGLPGGGTQGYDLSLNRYKELVNDEVEHRQPLEILAEPRAIEQEILQGIEVLEGMLP